MAIRTRTVVAVHGITVGGDERTRGYTGPTRKALAKFIAGMGAFDVPIREALWADLAQRFVSVGKLADAQAVLLSAIGGGALGALSKVLSWFGVPSLADVADLIADVFIYDGPQRTRLIRDHVRGAVLAERQASGRGVVLHGNSLGSVVALDVVRDMLDRGEIGPSIAVDRWPVRALLTTGSPLGLDLPLHGGFVDRAVDLAKRLPRPLDKFRWENVFDPNDPVVTGSLFGLHKGLVNLTRFPGYKRLRVHEITPQTGQHLRAHLGYWDHPLVVQALFRLANLA